MNLDNFLDNVCDGKPLIKEEAQSKDEQNKETEKLIKGLKKMRFNSMFKNVDRISDFMVDQGSTVRGVVKKTILAGAKDLFKQSRERSVAFRKTKEDTINKYVEVIVGKLELEGSLDSVKEETEFERITFEKIMEQMSDSLLVGMNNNDKLTFFMTQFLKTDMLESSEERKYHDRAVELIEYFVIQTMLLRIVLSSIQTIIARVASKVRLSKVENAEEKSKEVGKILIKFFKNYTESKYGAAIGKYLSTYVEDYYQSSKDRKEQFTKFENIINKLLGIK